MLTGELVNGARFFRSIGFQRIVRFGNIYVNAGLLQAYNLQLTATGRLYLLYLYASLPFYKNIRFKHSQSFFFNPLATSVSPFS